MQLCEHITSTPATFDVLIISWRRLWNFSQLMKSSDWGFLKVLGGHGRRRLIDWSIDWSEEVGSFAVWVFVCRVDSCLQNENRFEREREVMAPTMVEWWIRGVEFSFIGVEWNFVLTRSRNNQFKQKRILVGLGHELWLLVCRCASRLLLPWPQQIENRISLLKDSERGEWILTPPPWHRRSWPSYAGFCWACYSWPRKCSRNPSLKSTSCNTHATL